MNLLESLFQYELLQSLQYSVFAYQIQCLMNIRPCVIAVSILCVWSSEDLLLNPLLFCDLASYTLLSLCPLPTIYCIMSYKYLPLLSLVAMLCKCALKCVCERAHQCVCVSETLHTRSSQLLNTSSSDLLLHSILKEDNTITMVHCPIHYLMSNIQKNLSGQIKDGGLLGQTLPADLHRPSHGPSSREREQDMCKSARTTPDAR